MNQDCPPQPLAPQARLDGGHRGRDAAAGAAPVDQRPDPVRSDPNTLRAERALPDPGHAGSARSNPGSASRSRRAHQSDARSQCEKGALICTVAVEPAHPQSDAHLAPERGQVGRLAPIAAVNGPACPPAIGASAAGPRAVRSDVEAVLNFKRDLINAAARHGKEVCHNHEMERQATSTDYQSTSATIHAKCGRATETKEDQLRSPRTALAPIRPKATFPGCAAPNRASTITSAANTCWPMPLR